MPKEFRDLSSESQNAIIDAFIGEANTNLPENIKDEIRDWATPRQTEDERLDEIIDRWRDEANR